MTAYIYVIRSRDPNDTSQNFYIGSTKDLKQRSTNHRTNCKNTNRHDYDYKVYEYIRSMGGYDNFIMYPLAEIEYKDNNDLRNIEQKYIDLYKPALNGRNAVLDLEERNVSRECECGGKYSKKHRNEHFQTKKHLKYVLSLSTKTNAVIVEAMAALVI